MCVILILNVSGRTDIVAFYTDWFINRYKEGFVDVRNPFNPKLISRISFSDVDAIMFCSKNPMPIIKYLDEIDKPILFHVTLTPYGRDIEPNVPLKGSVINSIKKLSKTLGKENVVVRYDPIFISEKYSLDYHIEMFDDLCKRLDGYIEKIIISFLDEYKNVKKNRKILNYKELTLNDYEKIGKNFSFSSKKHNISVQTCFEDMNLVQYGFEKGECLSHKLAYKMTGKKYPEWKARSGGKCHCVEMVDIGYYNSCKHMCKYCYANYDEKKVNENFLKHNPKSSLLIGELEKDDIIKERIK